MNRRKRFFLLFFLLCFVCSCSFAFADEISDQQQSIPDNIDSPATVVVDITQLLNSNTQSEDPDQIQQVEVQDLQLVNVEQTRQTVTPSDANGLKAVLLTILGDYETVVTDYEYRNNNNTYMSHSIAIEQDYAWICSACIFGLVIYCTFRAIGGILCRA